MNYTLLLAPGRTETIESTGTFFAVVSSPIDLFIRLPGQEEVVYAEGDSYSVDAGDSFRFLSIRNPTTQTVTVVVYAGTGRYEQRRRTVLESRTEVFGQAATSIAAGASVVLDGVPTGKQIQRKSVMVSNMDNGGNLVLLDSSGKHCANIFPLTTVNPPVSGAITVKNDTGLPITAYISEIWYVTQ